MNAPVHRFFDMKPDPMGLGDLRVMLHDEAGRRWSRAAKTVKRAIRMNDILGLGDNAPMTMAPVADRAALFERWLGERLAADVGDDWMGPSIEAAGARAQATVAGVFDYQSLAGPPVAETAHVEPKSKTICCAAAGAALAGIRDAVSRRAASAVAASLLTSSQRRASRVAAAVDAAMGEGLARTRSLSEHALSMAYNQASLDAYEARGVTHVGTVVERRVLDSLFDLDPTVAAVVKRAEKEGKKAAKSPWFKPDIGVEPQAALVAELKTALPNLPPSVQGLAADLLLASTGSRGLSVKQAALAGKLIGQAGGPPSQEEVKPPDTHRVLQELFRKGSGQFGEHKPELLTPERRKQAHALSPRLKRLAEKGPGGWRSSAPNWTA